MSEDSDLGPHPFPSSSLPRLGRDVPQNARSGEGSHTLCAACGPSPGAPSEGGEASVETKASCIPREPKGSLSLQIQWSPCGREGGLRLPLGSCGSRPVSTLRGLAGVHVQGLQAVLTAHSAAPVEFTLTLGHPCDAGGVVASSAAHDFTAVHSSGGQVAHTAGCTQGA